ncbi:MAG: gamma-glutamyltransferase [Alphaproteobacteria bacterium]|nr:gamma-glutamyltransferase [Alphaproteobacteria bacterium]
MAVGMGAGKKGAVAAGDTETAKAAAEILRSGGNAFDAVLGALFASTVVEPVLSSLGGGGFLLAARANQRPVLYDFFAHTPRLKKSEVDFYPVLADFGAVTQEFHIGQGAIATPGVVKGAFAAHRDLGSMPLSDIVAPAVELARKGFRLSPLQAYIFDVVKPIYMATPACRAQYASPTTPDALIRAGETMRLPEKADFLEVLACEGEDLFYKGEVAAAVARDCEDKGGHLDRNDFESYEIAMRAPLFMEFSDARIYTNPPPSVGGILIAFALALLEESSLDRLGFGSYEYLSRLAKVMAMTNRARVEGGLNENPDGAARKLLDPQFLERYRAEVVGHPPAHRGTTHISVVDAAGNAASLTVSNGEGSGYIAPGTGIMFNNMLGEEDINPQGFQKWPENTRMSSMMAPSLVQRNDGMVVALGSGGSNRIRTAVLQVILDVLEFDIRVREAVALPRIHYERGVMNVEPGFDDGVRERLARDFDPCKLWDDVNLFFGGVHAVEFHRARGLLDGGGDPRRGGVSMVV